MCCVVIGCIEGVCWNVGWGGGGLADGEGVVLGCLYFFFFE